MASLIHMQKILSNRMQYFPSVEKAVNDAVGLQCFSHICSYLAIPLLKILNKLLDFSVSR